MKLILQVLIAIIINCVFSGKCPPKEVISPCKCDAVSCNSLIIIKNVNSD